MRGNRLFLTAKGACAPPTPVLRLLFASILVSFFAAAVVAAAPPSGAAEAPVSSRTSHGWVINDFDGDRIADLASAGPGRIDGTGYAREVSVSLTAFAKTDFTVRSASASIRLSVRDIDGDHDRDLVILEPWSLRPIGIWLNDGHGHFEEGNLAQYSATLGAPDSGSFALNVDQTDASPALHDERSLSASPDPSPHSFLAPSVFIHAEPVARATSFDRSDARPRAPPCLHRLA